MLFSKSFFTNKWTPSSFKETEDEIISHFFWYSIKLNRLNNIGIEDVLNMIKKVESKIDRMIENYYKEQELKYAV